MTNIDNINCNECQFINLTEEEQIDHKCLKYNIRIVHSSNNPYIKHNFIFPCRQCNGKSFIKREV
ncbi:hypothetical protein [Clostridium botulinum]|uniref:hypothetical protein n=1 Tax=Clostridium botulinum TaxID=1491 RepID=UPI0005B3426F|nr:hypothetical protein [Clostridium botulinum]MBN3402923.1 hypothetical protein [Clostridium botulinum]MBN3447568.1 hypothetical protein [Clostridium botulinum]QDY27124.1 hypothetical protein CGQ40_20685 [Clostridium botulinum]